MLLGGLFSFDTRLETERRKVQDRLRVNRVFGVSLALCAAFIFSESDLCTFSHRWAVALIFFVRVLSGSGPISSGSYGITAVQALAATCMR